MTRTPAAPPTPSTMSFILSTTSLSDSIISFSRTCLAVADLMGSWMDLGDGCGAVDPCCTTWPSAWCSSASSVRRGAQSAFSCSRTTRKPAGRPRGSRSVRVVSFATHVSNNAKAPNRDAMDSCCSVLHSFNKSAVLMFTEPTVKTGNSLPRKHLRRKERREDESAVLQSRALVT